MSSTSIKKIIGLFLFATTVTFAGNAPINTPILHLQYSVQSKQELIENKTLNEKDFNGTWLSINQKLADDRYLEFSVLFLEVPEPKMVCIDIVDSKSVHLIKTLIDQSGHLGGDSFADRIKVKVVKQSVQYSFRLVGEDGAHTYTGTIDQCP